jgi:hypothetical protein
MSQPPTTCPLPHGALQPLYPTLTHRQQKDQDAWAQTELSKTCPGKAWARTTNGYICGNGLHFVSDTLLSEGKGRFYRKDGARKWWKWPSYGRGCVRKRESAGVVAVMEK